MIVDHSGSLHMRITDGRADEVEAALLQVLAKRIRLAARRRIVLQCSQRVHDWLTVDKTPDVGIESAELFLNCQKTFCVGDRGRQFLSIADDAVIVD